MVEIRIALDPTAAPYLTQAQLTATVPLVGAWVNRDLAPAYSQGSYKVSAQGAAPLPGVTDHLWLLLVKGMSDVPGAAGYHTIDGRADPIGFVFAGTCAEYQMDWRTVLAHEVAEMCVNRFVLSTVTVQGPAGHVRSYVCECCDPVEAYGYPFTSAAGDFMAPDFVLPQWFRPGALGPYSKCGHAPAPLTPAASGGRAYYYEGDAYTFVGAAEAGTPETSPVLRLGKLARR